MLANKRVKDNAEGGFTLIEVLVAVLVLSIGIFGLIALESHTLKNNQRAYLRSQATILIYDIADKMRANMEVDYSGVTGASHASSCISVGSSCTPPTLAEKNVYEWEQSITDILPDGIGAINATGNITTVAISWNDDRNPDTGPDGREESFSVDFRL